MPISKQNVSARIRHEESRPLDSTLRDCGVTAVGNGTYIVDVRPHGSGEIMPTLTTTTTFGHGVIGFRAARNVVSTVHREWTQRRDQPWLSLVAIPLAMTATGLLQVWWTWPILLVSAWVGGRAWRWTWLLALQMCAFGTMWAYCGAVALALWPGHRMIVGIVWGGVMLLLAIMAALNRRYDDRPRGFLW